LITACERANAPHVSHHSLRHAYATLHQKQGTDLVLLSRLLGHANPTVTQNIYVDPFPEDLRDAGEKIKIGIVRKRGNKAIWKMIFG
jgi:site-specific recombinase XerD